MNDILKAKLDNMPKKPGCYLWKDNKGIVIYVGKAKNLFNRTKQYFLKDNDLKTKKLVNEIFDVDYVVVNNENESFLLENNLINQYKPKFNILLREINNFPYIVVTKEKDPRILYVHNKSNLKIKGTYYGPFANTNIKKYDLYNFISRMFPLRKCSSKTNKRCFYYDIGQCLGACFRNVDKKEYEINLKKINDFFSGKTEELLNFLTQKELSCAEKLMFEDSLKYLEMKKNLKAFSERQDIIFSKNKDEDMIGYHIKENAICIVIFKYVNGNLINKYDITTLFYCEENEIISTLVYEYYKNQAIQIPKKVYLSLDENLLNQLSKSLEIEFINPQKGIKKEIINKAFSNAIIGLKNKYLNLIANENKEINSLIELQKILNIDNLNRIEIFDNSNIFNDCKVSAMVVYINGKKAKNEYRKFNIKNTFANNDFEFMQEVIYRRYSKLVKQKHDLPNLIIVDGGKIQVSAALISLQKLNLNNSIPIIGLVKDIKHKTDRLITSNFEEIILDKKSNLYFFLLNMQDEVHRYVINFHRQKRSNSLFSNSLLQVKNLGKKRIEKLIEQYETIENIKKASIDELAQILPKQVAIDLKSILQNL